jgi:hypothetical protein
MLTTPQTPDPDVTVFARIPQPLDEPTRIARYDRPLGAKLAELEIDHSLRGFCLPETLNHPAGVALEVRVHTPKAFAIVAQCLANFGAPRETLIELETDTASMETSLAELMNE